MFLDSILPSEERLMHTWGVAVLLLLVTWVVLAGLPGAPVKPLVGKLALAFGFIVIGAGFYFMSLGPVDNPKSITWAPIALVLGFCVIVPAALLYHRRDSSETQP
jgi:peptidoglycan/LPS O-acetylase OafA/YrhL